MRSILGEKTAIYSIAELWENCMENIHIEKKWNVDETLFVALFIFFPVYWILTNGNNKKHAHTKHMKISNTRIIRQPMIEK